MAIWNVLSGVVQLIEADSAYDAQIAADQRVRAAVAVFGDTCDLPPAFGEAFESEDQDQDALQSKGHVCARAAE